VKGEWEDRFERRYGHWRGYWDGVVMRFLECGIHESGFARVRCPKCAAEYLVAFSCQTRTFCPSCAAKRSAVFSTFLSEEVLGEVGHWMMTFTVPKMLRPYFLHHRGLLGGLCRSAWETVSELMTAAAAEEDFTPAMVAVVHTAGDFLGWHPHIHALVPRGGWTRDGKWIAAPWLDAAAAEKLFRHKVLKLLQAEGLIADERIELLLSWRHSGFSVDASVRVEPEDSAAVTRVSRYILRPPLSLGRMSWQGGEGEDVDEVAYRAKDGSRSERFDPMDFVARVLMHAAEPRLHTVRYYGAYSSVVRARMKREGVVIGGQAAAAKSTPDQRRRLRRSWAKMIAKVYEVDPLTCACGAEMKIISFITEYKVVKKILDHVRKVGDRQGRAPPARAASA
jgi:hypothetical protein